MMQRSSSENDSSSSDDSSQEDDVAGPATNTHVTQDEAGFHIDRSGDERSNLQESTNPGLDALVNRAFENINRKLSLLQESLGSRKTTLKTTEKKDKRLSSTRRKTPESTSTAEKRAKVNRTSTRPSNSTQFFLDRSGEQTSKTNVDNSDSESSATNESDASITDMAVVEDENASKMNISDSDREMRTEAEVGVVRSHKTTEEKEIRLASTLQLERPLTEDDIYICMDVLGKDGNRTSALQSTLKLHAQKQEEVMKKSVITPDFERKESVPPFIESLRKLKRERRAEREKTKGKKWYDMPATEVTDEVKNDLEILQMRGALDPKRFYKHNDLKVPPKYFQMGTVVETSADFYSARIPKKQRKRTLVEELLADAEFKRYNKRKQREIEQQKQRSEGPYKHWRKVKGKKWRKKKNERKKQR